MISLPVLLPDSMFLLGVICTCPMFLSGGLCPRGLCSKTSQMRKAGSTRATGMFAFYKRKQSNTKQILISTEIVIIDLIALLIQEEINHTQNGG